MKSSLLLIILFSITSLISVGQNIEQDSLALVDIYNSTDGVNWVNKEGWLTGDLYTWDGVTIGMGGNDIRVVRLNLSMKSLEGSIPGSIGNLDKLTRLWLYGNKLSGHIPSSIGNLSDLILLDLGSNQLSGDIPPEIGNLQGLLTLILSNNDFNNSIPEQFPGLSGLLWLDISYCNFYGEIPSVLGALTSLEYLDISNNEYSGVLPESFSQLIGLKTFNAYNNNLSGEFPIEILSGMYSLENLNLGSNEFEGELPDSLDMINSVKVLNLGGNKLVGDIPPSFGNMSNLESAEFGGNKFETLPGEINQMSNLKTLMIAYNLLHSLPLIEGSENLMGIYIPNNRLTFEDIIPNINAAPSVIYAPQKKIGTEISIICEPGETKYLKWETGGENNHYQWFKDGVELSAATGNELPLEYITFEDDGNYTLSVKNDGAPLLTLESYPISVAVRVCLFDGLSGQGREFSIKVVKVEGEAELMRNNRIPVELRGGEVLFPPDRIFTGMESWVELAFADNSRVVVHELTDVSIRSFEKLGNAVNVQLWLKAGEVDAAVVERSAVKSDFKIRTPTATCSVRGTSFGVKVDSVSSETAVQVSEGIVTVIPDYSPADSIDLSKWESVTVTQSSIGPVNSFEISDIEILPDTTWVTAGGMRLFSVVGSDGEGRRTSVPVAWDTDAGYFEEDWDMFHAGTEAGEFAVHALVEGTDISASGVIIVNESTSGIPQKFSLQDKASLFQNYPNPFKVSTTIDYKIPRRGFVTLKVLNILGKEVSEIVNESKAAGIYSIVFDASDFENGTYFCTLIFGKSILVKKMLLIK